MTAEQIIARLDKARSTGKGRWMACCPAHQDRTPSLSIRETEDGRILVHCFAGCAVHDVVAAIGMEMSDLFPDSRRGHRIPQLPTWKRQRLEDALTHARLVVAMAKAARERGENLSDADAESVRVAVARIPRIEKALKRGGNARG